MEPKERTITDIFLASVLIKGTQGLLELLIGGFLLFSSTGRLSLLLIKLSESEILDGPKDFFSNWLLQAGTNLSINGKVFIAIYLLSHGIIKLFLIIGLLRKKIWSYWAFIGIMILFISYQVYRIIYSYSNFLFIMTLFDIALTYLVWRESIIVARHLEKTKKI
jgi:uncharacterized membrane protein